MSWMRIVGAGAGLFLFATLACADGLPPEAAAPLSPEILKRLNAEEQLAKSPAGARPGFAYSYDFKSQDPRIPLASKVQQTFERVADTSTLAARMHYEESDGYLKETSGYRIAGGLLLLSEVSHVTNPDGSKETMAARLIEYNIDGNIYPVAAGNEFKIEMTMSGTIEWNLTHDCAVTRETQAIEFDPALTGRAFKVTCKIEMTGQETGLQDYYYLEELDYFVPDLRSSNCPECKGFALVLK